MTLSLFTDPDSFMKRNWHHCFYWGVAYLCAVHFGPLLMKSLPQMKLKLPLVVWNLVMTIYSYVTLHKLTPEFFDTVRRHGLVSSFCERGRLFDGDLGYWVALFHFSKLVELGDTLFLIIRKRNVVYIHYFHHFIVLLWCWYSYRLYTAPARWGVFMNAAVHTAMYFYFFLSSLGLRLPGCVKMAITSTQIIQFIFGTVICVIVVGRVYTGQHCDTTKPAATLQLCIYLYLLVLFSKYFHRAYIAKVKAC